MRFSLPSIKCSAAPPSFRPCCLNCTRRFDLITARSAVVGSWEEPPNIWLTVAKNAFVGWDLNFRVRMLLKSAVRLPKKKSIFIQSVNEVSLRSPRSMCRSLQLNQFHRFVALFTSIQPGTSPKHSTSLPVVSAWLFPFHQLWVTYLFFVPFENVNPCIQRRKLFFSVWQWQIYLLAL